MHGFACSNSVHLRFGRRGRRSGRGKPCLSARIGPFQSRHGWVCTLAVLVMLLLLPASASAAAPTCDNVQLSVLHDRTLGLSGAPCTGGTPPLTLSVVTPPTHGQIDLIGGVPQYTPNLHYVGADSFTYKATDSTAQVSSPATVTITVTDQAPTCNDTSTATTVGRAVDISNLFDCDDADGEPLTIHFGDGEHGVTDDNGTTYTPDPGFVGTDRVLFYADDDVLQSPIRAITVTVTAPSPPPPAPVVVTPKDTSPPVFSLTHPKQKLADARSQGIKLVETSNEPGTLKVTITVDKNTARKLKIKPNAKGPVTIGTLTRTVGVGKQSVTIKLTTSARKALKRARKMTCLVTVRLADAAGNVATHTITLTLKR
jgi:hypothetical protein